MFKRFFGLILALSFVLCFIPVYAEDNAIDWKTLYEAKIAEIEAEYQNGTRDDEGILDMFPNGIYFSLQDINFDGVPELYHALCSMFELDPSVMGTEEIYYIENGQVVKGTIDPSADFCFLPVNAGNKGDAGNTDYPRWQFAMRDKETGAVCFVTADCYSGFMDVPERTYSRVSFDSTSGNLTSEVLLHQDIDSYEVPLYLEGYDYVGADCYTSISNGEWNIWNWKPSYTAPEVVLNGGEIRFDVQPQIINDRTMVPLRAIFEALGAAVEWDDATKTVTAIKGDITIKMTIGADSFKKNDESVALDSPATIVDSRTLVPVRAIAESFGSKVGWIAESKTVTIED